MSKPTIKFVRTPAQHKEDGAEWDVILPDGSVPAWIESEMTDDGYGHCTLTPEVRVGWYTVTFRQPGHEDRTFCVDDYPHARAALAAAKRYVRKGLGF